MKADFRLLVITGRKLSKLNLIALTKRLIDAGVKAIQIREKDLPASELLRLARRVKSASNKSIKLIVNDRVDIAILAGLDGVHSPVNGISLAQVKQFAPKLICGKSVHSLSDAVSAEKEGYDYVLLGPVFRTPAKIKYGPPLGLKMLNHVCKKVKIPVFAVGGINAQRAVKCARCGAHGVAVIREVMASKNIKGSISEFKSALGSL